MQHHQEELTISAEETGLREVLVRISGELDIRTSSALLGALGTMLADDDVLLLRLDLSDVRFCDHAGLRALHALGEAAGPDRVRIVAAHSSVDTILRLCRIPAFLGHTPPNGDLPGPFGRPRAGVAERSREGT
ncbi:STAS domain-containing protein [Actinoplanes utahensis]|uniref:STAS domain-containing protein n=1 Tax=Actinoplanes utahensis TaxID=1869 RepID=A0A0A6UR82_ACTUT|nr:STAS domain-containing protein [Actinoplanes utahensis]KHD77936.1 hypothetical protein MB27_07310 [Actinoplanes utahensis]GIF29896.1 hypothetical protein Aut01nite_28820 [Actinoplanes utahensis]